jgi:hypothetical protein
MNVSKLGHPQQFEERIPEEEPPVGRTLTGVHIRLALCEAKRAKPFRLRGAYVGANEEVVDFKHDATLCPAFTRPNDQRNWAAAVDVDFILRVIRRSGGMCC